MGTRVVRTPAWRGAWKKRGGPWSDTRRDCQEDAISRSNPQTSVHGTANAVLLLPGVTLYVPVPITKVGTHWFSIKTHCHLFY